MLSDQAGAADGFSEFPLHPTSVESLLNTKAMQSFTVVDSGLDPDGTFRCTLHTIGFVGFQVPSVLHLRFDPNSDECTVKILFCRFEGSDSIEQQNVLLSVVMIYEDSHNTRRQR